MSNTPLDRKHQILDHLHTHLRNRTARRRFIRAAAASTAAASALAIAAYLAVPGLFTAAPIAPLAHHIQPSPHVTTPESSTLPAPAVPSAVTIRIAHTEPIPTTPCETAPAATICILSDDQLLAALAEAGRPSGLVRTGGQTFIVPRELDPRDH